MNSLRKNKIAAIVVTFERLESLQRCIAGINAQTAEVDKIIVIDNSRDDITERHFLKNGADNVCYLRPGKNIGPAGGFKKGFQLGIKGSYEYSWCFDDDCTPVSKNCLEELLKAFPGDGKLGMARPMMKDPTTHRICGSGAWSGSLILNEAVSKSGYPKEEFFIEYEDTEFALRISERYTINRCDRVFVEHRLGKKTDIHDLLFKGMRMKPWRGYYFVRNRIVVKREASKIELMAFMFHVVKMLLLSMVFGRKRLTRVKLIFMGVIDGFKRNIAPTVMPD